MLICLERPFKAELDEKSSCANLFETDNLSFQSKRNDDAFCGRLILKVVLKPSFKDTTILNKGTLIIL